VTVTLRAGDRVTVTTWDPHPALADVVAALLGVPSAAVEL